MIKVWDYEANKTLPYYFQSFIGHTYPVNCLMFNPTDNGIIISSGEKDGIYIWNFYGDTKTEFAHPIKNESSEEQLEISNTEKQVSILEKMRQSRKQSK